MASSQHCESGDIRDRPGSPRTKVSWPAASAAVATRLQARIMSNCTARGGKAGGQQGRGHSEWGALPFRSLCLHPVGPGAWRVRMCTWGSGGPGRPSGEPQRWGSGSSVSCGPMRGDGAQAVRPGPSSGPPGCGGNGVCHSCSASGGPRFSLAPVEALCSFPLYLCLPPPCVFCHLELEGFHLPRPRAFPNTMLRPGDGTPAPKLRGFWKESPALGRRSRGGRAGT